jgi:hypothetical protein
MGIFYQNMLWIASIKGVAIRRKSNDIVRNALRRVPECGKVWNR